MIKSDNLFTKTMLLQFKIGNFLSFKEVSTFSLVAANISENKENIFKIGDLDILKSAAIYGANASGKTNFIKALYFMKSFIFSSHEIQSNLVAQKFKLDDAFSKKPSFFEITFLSENIIYRYGFEVDSNIIVSEWLFSKPNLFRGKESELFTRENDEIIVGAKFKEGKGLEKRTRNETLFLSVVSQFNGGISQKVLTWFKNLNIVSSIDESSYINFSLKQLSDEKILDKTKKLLKQADLSIDDIVPIINEDTAQKSLKIETKHKKFNKTSFQDKYESFDLLNNESDGTKKLFFLSPLLIDTLENNKVLIIDELDIKLHPLLTNFITNLFNSKKNTNSQLIFNTHNTNLLENKSFRRDQIWFTEKDRFGGTELFSLVEYKDGNNKKIRKSESISKNYIEGKYGGIPIIK